MDIPSFTQTLPMIPDAEQTLLVRSLLQLIAQQQEHIQRLEDEIRRLKGGPQRPQLKPSTLEPGGSPGVQRRRPAMPAAAVARGAQRQPS